ncbi:MAG TPA: HIT domain-containing protein [Candidatus Nanoarchaeia archaeon]|nr:HIT domain-containing protein [Candidatus Nanoarchaeia archaeon]
MEGCIFCRIAKGEIPCAKIWEDEKHMAFLDMNPNVMGMTLVVPKQHFDSYTFDMPDKDHHNLIDSAKKTAKMLEKGLGVPRVAMVMEGMGVNHAHIKLYPLFILENKTREPTHRLFFEAYEGYISTELGPQRSNAELSLIAQEIIKRNK